MSATIGTQPNPRTPVTSILETTSARSRADFPPPRSKNAPKTFKGKYDEVAAFLKEFDSLAKYYNLSNDDRFELLPRYVGTKVKQTLYGLKEFQKQDWPKLVDTLKKLYNHDRIEKAFKLHHLVLFTEGSSAGSINNLIDFHKYQRRYMRIAGWLSGKELLGDTDFDRYFWKGLPKKTQALLRTRIEIVDPTIDISKPYPMHQVTMAAEHVFNMSRFDDEESADEATVSSDSGSESSSEDSDNEVIHRKKKVKARKTKVQEPKSRAKPNGKISKSEEDEVVELIDRLGKLNITDPQYAILYYRVTLRAPHMVPFFPTPSPLGNSNPHNFNSNQADRPSQVNNGPLECYFCGGQGHTTRRCQQADALIQQGTIMRGQDGRLTWPDGSTILRRGGDEKILEAINRELAFRAGVNKERPATVNLITAMNFQDSDSDEEYVMPQARAKMDRKQAREALKKYQFDGVEIPKRPIKPKPVKPSVPPAPSPSVIETTAPAPISLPPVIPHDPQPILPQNYDDDAIMEDFEERQIPEILKRKPAMTKKPKDPNLKAYKLQNRFRRELNMDNLKNSLFDTPISLKLRDILGLSPDSAQMFMEYCRVTRGIKEDHKTAQEPQKVNLVHKSSSTPAVNATFDLKENSKLIKLRIKLNGKEISAFIDSGSEIDVIHRDAITQAGVPYHPSKSITMKDASGNTTILQGLCRNIPIHIGNDVITLSTQLWVADTCPFSFLLGRPWCRYNLISIDERPEGTFLTHRDKHGNIVWEVCTNRIREITLDENLQLQDQDENTFFG